MSVFSDYFERCFPFKTIKATRNIIRKPWMTPGLIKSCKKKHKLFSKFKSNPTEHRERKYKTYRNRLNQLVRTAKKRYFEEKLTEAKSDLKLTWKVIKEALNKPKATTNYPSEFHFQGKNFNESENIANQFNEYFSKIGLSLDAIIPNTHPDFRIFLDSRIYPHLKLYPATETEVNEIICSLKSSNMSSGHDHIPTFLIKALREIISLPLSQIINISMEEGSFPDSLKIAKVVPIYKAGDASSFSNYRPVSVLPAFSKIFEKVMYNRLLTHLTDNNILSPSQFGFRAGHSTSHAILYLVDQITRAIDRREMTIGVFLDLSKAFDTVNHTILLHKLQHYGISGTALRWFDSYLLNRKQYVKYNHANSEFETISCGVPQGSILGPLLFYYTSTIFPMSVLFYTQYFLQMIPTYFFLITAL